MAKKKVVAKKATPKAATAKKAAVSAKKVNKAEEIRLYAKANPSDGPKAIVEALGKKGIQVTPPQVSNTLSSAKKKVAKKRGRKPATATASSSSVAIQDLVEAKKFADSVGGADNASELLKALKKLSD